MATVVETSGALVVAVTVCVVVGAVLVDTTKAGVVVVVKGPSS